MLHEESTPKVVHSLLIGLLTLVYSASLIGAFVYCPVSASWETKAAVPSWLRIADRGSIEDILENVSTGSRYNIVWRPRTVTDMRRQSRPQIPAEQEWLWRWDTAEPRHIFQTGFVPRVDISSLVDGSSYQATNLRQYVSNNIASVYVSTTRRDWTPRRRSSTFRYDIFAPGGIDVNPTLGSHRWQNQMEIAFVGGIRTDYIYGAVELDQHQTQIRYHRNALYRGPSAPLSNRRTRCDIPIVLYNSIRREQQNYCEATGSSFRRKRATGNELMRTSGQTLDAVSDCSHWYKVNVQYLNFDQPGEVGKIEPFGEVNVYSYGSNTRYASSDVWQYYPGNGDTPSVSKDTNLYKLATCLVVQSDTDSGVVNICFDGHVSEYDPATANDEIAKFATKCMSTYPNSNPSRSYTYTDKGEDGTIKIGFKVTPCNQNCLDNDFDHNSINGRC